MEEFRGKVAVITGAANGLGRALAERSAQEGMKVLLADIDAEALARVEKDLKAAGASALAVVTDVSKVEDVQALAKRALDAFGGVHLLCNTAAVHCLTPLAEVTLEDWRWVLGVNLYGVIHTVATFLPIMFEQDAECHIVNTAPVLGGFCALPFNGPFNVSEFAIVTLSEILFLELATKQAKVGVTLLSPDYAQKAILDGERVWPAEDPSPHFEQIVNIVRATSLAETCPERLAEMVFGAVREGKFYLFPHPSSKVIMHERLAHIDDQTNPENILGLMGIAG